MSSGTNLSVLLVNTSDRGGGAESVALGLQQALPSRGIRSILAVGFRRSASPGVVELPRSDDLGGRLYDTAQRRGMPRLARAARSLADPGVIADVVRGREDFRFPGSRAVLDLAASADVVHLHNLHGGYFDLRLVSELSRFRPTVITLHDEWAFTGHCALTLGCERWRDACGSCPHLDVYPRLRRDGTALNLSRKRDIWRASRLHVVAPTRWLLERARVSILQNAGQSWNVVSNGIDLDVFKPGDRDAARAALGIPAGASVVVFAAAGAQMNQFKDFPTLERALGELGATDGQPIVALTVGQEGETRQLGRVELRHTGFLDRPDLAGHFVASDLYVHPARAEAQGLTLMEALACGIPAVASAVGGVPDVVRDGETGLLVPPGDARALGTAILELLADEAGRRRMSLAAVDDARLRFGHDAHVNGYLGVYEAAISAHRH